MLVTANVEETMNKIIPQEQHLFPVSFKRKLEYEGFFLKEVIDKRKVELWYNFLRQKNKHYQDIVLDTNLIDEFCESTRELAELIERDAPKISTPEDKIEKETMEEIPLANQYDTLMSDKYEHDVEEDTFANRYAEMIIQYETLHKIPIEEDSDDIRLDDEFFPDEENDDSPEEEDVSPAKRPKTDNISVAPGEKGFLKSFGDQIFIEEMAFPHLFCRGSGNNISGILPFLLFKCNPNCSKVNLTD